MNEVLDFLRSSLEPDQEAELDDTAAEPLEWTANTLYAYLLPATTHEPFESGPSVLERFSARIVYVADDGGESARRERSRDVSDLLDAKRTRYLDTLRGLMSAPPFWAFAAAAETSAPDTLLTRAVSIRLNGYRILA